MVIGMLIRLWRGRGVSNPGGGEREVESEDREVRELTFCVGREERVMDSGAGKFEWVRRGGRGRDGEGTGTESGGCELGRARSVENVGWAEGTGGESIGMREVEGEAPVCLGLEAGG